MTCARFSVPLLRTLHLLGISAWIGGGIGIMLLLFLDCRAQSAAELQAFNRVIDAVDDCIIAPGAIATMVSGILLAQARRLPVLQGGYFSLKLYCTGGAILFGLFFVAPWLEKLLVYSRRDDLAVFDDRLYAHSFLVSSVGCVVQSLVVLGLLLISVIRPRLGPQIPGGSAGQRQFSGLTAGQSAQIDLHQGALRPVTLYKRKIGSQGAPPC